ncbi:MAG: N-acetylmuramic acid 6-phosphate etherase [Verrucomicrobia bacterium]|nr:N-acetylmuramic acid 6-phosphate etherase [Verrucomicrobiota bacterium]
MTKGTGDTQSALFLGIEGGGTRTVALLADGRGRLLRRREFGPANFKLLTDAQLIRHLRAIAAAFPKPSAVAIGLAGARGEPEWARIRAAASRAWRDVPCHATHDLETAIAAADAGLKTQDPRLPQVLILSGTGSCCYGRTPDGRTARFGGWGHLLGDKGSGYEIGLRALKAVVFYLDRDGTWSRVGQRILSNLMLNEPGDLIAWAQSATKMEIAALAVEVFAAAAKHDAIARDILKGAASSLAKDGVSSARKLVKTGAPVQFVLAGSVLLKQPRFAKKVAAELRHLWPGAVVTPLKRESAWGAVALAARQFKVQSSKFKVAKSVATTRVGDSPPLPLASHPLTHSLSPTEERNPRSMNLDRLALGDAIELMLSEDSHIPTALLAEKANIEAVVRRVVRAFKHDGHLFYVGAGTSGRLGVLDASECPPTFRTPPDLVQGIIAGGEEALWRAVEGAEDDSDAGAVSMKFRGVGAKDVVVGIAASGHTPFVWGALREAQRRGAFTVLLCFNPTMKELKPGGPHVVIAPSLGPEILTGSTRLKAGTATKLVLNIFTTLAMVHLGKVVSNLMVDVNPSNVKLRDRAVRIVKELTGADYATARRALEKSGWVIKKAWRRLGGEKLRAEPS